MGFFVLFLNLFQQKNRSEKSLKKKQRWPGLFAFRVGRKKTGLNLGLVTRKILAFGRAIILYKFILIKAI